MGFGRTKATPEADGPAPSPVLARPGPVATPTQASLLRLQRVAGNAAVVRRLAEEQEAPEAEDHDLVPITGEDAELAPRRGPMGVPDDDGRKGAYEPNGTLDPRWGTWEGGKKTIGKEGAGPKGEPMPKRERKGGPPKFDEDACRRSLEEMVQRVQRYPAIEESQFIPIMRRYVDAAVQANKDGSWDKVTGHLMDAVTCLDGLRAFTIGGKVYERLGAAPKPEVLDELAEQAMEGVVLWSKLNKYKAIDTVEEGEKGNSLEASAAGTLFDGLSFGMDYGLHEPLRKQWSVISETFVEKARGVVHAQVFRGIEPTSVLTTTEWPKISKMMREGKVVAFVVHFFDWVNGELVEDREPRTIRHPSEFQTLPTVAAWDEKLQTHTSGWTWDEKKQTHVDSDFFTAQNQVQEGEEKRHKKDAHAKLQQGHEDKIAAAAETRTSDGPPPEERKQIAERFRTAKSFWLDLQAKPKG